MGTMSAVGDLMQLIEQDIPEGRRHLQDSHRNLDKVAAYCEGNYLQAKNKRHALEETKNYTTQSLASVAYQINTLATNFVHLLDLQMTQLADMESSINHLSQTVMIHKEKVARREIGVLTTNKTTARPAGVKNPGIIFPDQPERPVKYMRRSIDYTVLDEVGHGVKQVQQQGPRSRQSSMTSVKSGMAPPAGPAPGPGQAPTSKPPTPPSTIYSHTGSLSRAVSSPYRTPVPAVAPPSVPSNYAPNYPRSQSPQVQIQASAADRRSGYAAVSNNMMAPSVPPPAPPPGPPAQPPGPPMGAPPAPPPAPPMGLVQPMQHMVDRGPATPPPPQMPANLPRISTQYRDSRLSSSSPPLPPPPQVERNESFECQYPPAHAPGGRRVNPFTTQASFDDDITLTSMHNEPADWAPKTYLEKVVAIYDYQCDKEDELSFQEGSVIYVIRKNDDGWYEGVMDGLTGLFPGNYVEPCI